MDVHSYHTRYATKGNFYKASFRTNWKNYLISDIFISLVSYLRLEELLRSVKLKRCLSDHPYCCHLRASIRPKILYCLSCSNRQMVMVLDNFTRPCASGNIVDATSRGRRSAPHCHFSLLSYQTYPLCLPRHRVVHHFCTQSPSTRHMPCLGTLSKILSLVIEVIFVSSSASFVEAEALMKRE